MTPMVGMTPARKRQCRHMRWTWDIGRVTFA
jgi:hypothetical protein